MEAQYIIETLTEAGAHQGQVLVNSLGELLVITYNYGKSGQKFKVYNLGAEIMSLG